MSNSVIGPRGEINAINFYINIIINCLISSCRYTHRLINLSTFLLKKVSFVIDSGFYSNSQLASVQQTRDSGVLSSKLYIPHPLPKCFWDNHRKSTEKIQHPESVHTGSKTLFLSITGMVHTLTQQLLLHVQYWNQITPDTVLVWMGQKFISPTHSPEGVSR